ncbi:MAG: glycoside hydrolase domain-containing protein, partial [Candidatus Omnitrophota bacterium]
MRNALLKISAVLIVLSVLISWQRIHAMEGGVSLLGAHYCDTVNAGEGFDITFYLMPLEPITEDCNMFIHLLSGGKMINADVAVPSPTSKWKVGEVIKVGPFRVYAPLDAAPGDYAIEAGLFRAQETKLGTHYRKIPYLNSPRVKDWHIGSVRIQEPSGKDPDAPQGDNDHDIYIQDSLVKVFPDHPRFLGKADKTVKLNAAQNEFESAQISIMASKRKLDSIELNPNDFVRIDGGKGAISKRNVILYSVGYVNTKKPYYNTPRTGPWPDPLLPLDGPVDIEEKMFKTFWLQVYVPKDSPAGVYLGTIGITENGAILDSVKVNLTVWDFSLPDEAHLKTAFDLKESILLKYYPKEQDEEGYEYENRIKRVKQAYCLDMLKHRLNPIHNMGNPKLLEVKKGAYSLDFSDFDRDTEFYLKKGQEVFSIGEYWPWQSKDMWGRWYGLKSRDAVLGTFSAYGRHLEKKRWLRHAYAYIFDETFYRVKEVTSLIHQAHPGIKNLLTMTPDPEYTDIDIWCPRINKFDPLSVEELKSNGKEVWTYVAGSTRPYPNLNLDVMAIECRILPWICWRFGLQGLLYWSVNWWVNVNPWDDAMTFNKQNGNGSLYYPGKEGPVGSIRLEVLRDGMEDYELFYMLKTAL